MPSRLETASSIELPSQATTVTAADLQGQLVAAIADGHDIEIDASAVESLGQAVLQLLIAAQVEAERTSIGCHIVNPSAAFSERVARCGLDDRIGLSAPEGNFQ